MNAREVSALNETLRYIIAQVSELRKDAQLLRKEVATLRETVHRKNKTREHTNESRIRKAEVRRKLLADENRELHKLLRKEF
jgi:hypothetical protein